MDVVQKIVLSEALKIFNLRDRVGMLVPFDIGVRTLNKKTLEGGKYKFYRGAKYLPPANPKDDHEDNIHNILDPIKAARDPNHFKNRTRNIEIATGEIKTISIDFIIRVNEYEIIYG